MAKKERFLPTAALTEYERCLQKIFKTSWGDWQRTPARLAKSPLASPYFLSHLLADNGKTHSDVALGQALLKAIRQAAGSFWQNERPRNREEMQAALDSVIGDKDHDHYHPVHLELRFFKEFIKLKTVRETRDHLIVAVGDEFELFNGTIRRIGQALLSQLDQYAKPLPPKPENIIGAEGKILQIQGWLQAEQTVYLTGQGGVGKSTLATLAAHAWPNVAFWYTIRPNLSDRLSTFLFELGQFLHQQGHSNLWKLVLAEAGNIQDGYLALNALDEDLKVLHGGKPLLVVDEVDLLYNVDPDLAQPHHVQFLEFISALRGKMPLLLVGQRTVLEYDHYLDLAGLSLRQLDELLQKYAISPLPPKEDRVTLLQATQGNPRLLLLCIALYEQERSQKPETVFADIVKIVSKAPGFGPLFNRLWDRLDTYQRELLQRLAVYPDSAPLHYWPKNAGEEYERAMTQLMSLRLIEIRAQGAVGMLPALRERIYRERLTPDKRDCYHLAAAAMLIPLAEYTNAAYHLEKADELADAIRLWYPMMHSEVLRGQTAVAYTIFVGMKHRNLSSKESRALVEIQAHLHKLYGETEAGLEMINDIDLGDVSEQRARLLILKGGFEEALGFSYTAEETYKRSIDTTARLIEQTATSHYGCGMTHIRQRGFPDADKAALKVELQLQILRGILAQEAGNFREAYNIYNETLSIATKLDDLQEVALSHKNLSAVQTWREQFDNAISHAELAKDKYKEIGDKFAMNRVDNAISAIHLEAGNYAEAIRVGERAVLFFEGIKNSYFAMTTKVNVAEAYFYQGDLVQAKTVAEEIIAEEEPHAMPYAYHTIGLVHKKNGHFRDAGAAFKYSLDMARQTKDTMLEAFARRGYGNMLCLLDHKAEGLEELHHALNQFKEMEKHKEIEATEKLLKKFRNL